MSTPPVRSEPVLRRCNYCHQQGTKMLKCGQCRTAIYCGQECQKSDWLMHKPVCHKSSPSKAKSSFPASAASSAYQIEMRNRVQRLISENNLAALQPLMKQIMTQEDRSLLAFLTTEAYCKQINLKPSVFHQYPSYECTLKDKSLILMFIQEYFSLRSQGVALPPLTTNIATPFFNKPIEVTESMILSLIIQTAIDLKKYELAILIWNTTPSIREYEYVKTRVSEMPPEIRSQLEGL